MDSVVRGAIIYLFLLLLFRMTGKRTMAQITPFDLVLLLLISEAGQQGLLGEDFSITNAVLVIVTILGIDQALDLLAGRSPRIEQLLQETPLVVVRDGKPLQDRLEMVDVTLEDVLAAARSTHGLERMEQIRYAILETSGSISIIPRAA